MSSWFWDEESTMSDFQQEYVNECKNYPESQQEFFGFFNKHIDFALFCSTLTLDKRLIDAAIVCAIFSKYNF